MSTLKCHFIRIRGTETNRCQSIGQPLLGWCVPRYCIRSRTLARWL